MAKSRVRDEYEMRECSAACVSYQEARGAELFNIAHRILWDAISIGADQYGYPILRGWNFRDEACSRATVPALVPALARERDIQNFATEACSRAPFSRLFPR